jgi:sugar O-acyltransferase (sialic acid O-acetyltransferase NeuD family)
MQKRELVIIGGGGHTRVLVGMLQAAGLPLRGIATSNAALVGTHVFDVPVLGLEDQIALNPAEVTLVNGVGNLASREGAGLAPRAALYQRYRARGFDFLPLIARHAVVQPHVIMGEGVQVMSGAVVQPGTILGENVIINTQASVDHDVVIYPHCHIAPGAILCGNVVIGEETHIGAGAVVIQGIRIGCNVVIGAGAIITHHVPDGAIVRPAASEQTKLSVTAAKSAKAVG